MYNLLLRQGTVFTDGSSDKCKATYAVVIQPPEIKCPLKDMDEDSFIHFDGWVDGSTDDLHSYRAELSGILAAIEYTNRLCNKHGISTGLCTIYCDNKGALSASFGTKRPTPRWSCFDLVWRIRQELIASPIHWKSHHVKGHQDERSDFVQLSSIAQGNVLADHYATQAYNKRNNAQLDFVRPPWTIMVHDKTVSGNFAQTLKTEIYKPLMINKWASIFRIPEEKMLLCDWKTIFTKLLRRS
jgi:RNase H.